MWWLIIALFVSAYYFQSMLFSNEKVYAGGTALYKGGSAVYNMIKGGGKSKKGKKC